MRRSILWIGICIFVVIIAAVLLPLKKIIGAVAPTVDTVTATNVSGGTNISTFTLVESTTTTLYLHGQITDEDGCADVATNGTVTGKFYRTNHASSFGCVVDNNDCYSISNDSCTKTNCNPPGDNVFNYECTAAIQYYADTTSTGPNSATDWTARITATDAGSLTGSNTDTIEMETTTALNMSPNIFYGTLNLGADSDPVVLSLDNTGNSGIDVDLNVNGDLICTGSGSSNIDAGSVRYSLTSGFDWVSGTALTTTTTELELNHFPRTDDASPSVKNLFFRLRMPSSGIGGNCTNVLSITAKTDTENGW